MRWLFFIVLTLSIGLVQMFAGAALPYLPPTLRGEWLLLVAFHVGYHCQPAAIVPVFWWCGCVHDSLLGTRFGASMLLFLPAAWLVVSFRRRFRRIPFYGRLLIAIPAIAAVILLRTALETRALGFLAETNTWIHAGWNTLYSILLSPVVGGLLSLSWLRPWKETDAPTFGLVEA